MQKQAVGGRPPRYAPPLSCPCGRRSALRHRADGNVAAVSHVYHVPTATSIILCVSKIQNGDILVLADTGCPEEWKLSECYRRVVSEWPKAKVSRPGCCSEIPEILKVVPHSVLKFTTCPEYFEDVLKFVEHTCK